MKLFRKILFWSHLTVGVIAGIVVLIMSVTGVLLTYEKQMIAWADTRNYRAEPPAGAARLPVETLLAKAREAKPNAQIATLSLQSDPSYPAAVGLGREGNLYLNPYTGAVWGEGSKGLRDFFHVVTDWHRWLGQDGPGRTTARAITGACNLGFLFLVITGIYIWFPRIWTRPQFKNVLWFKRGLPGKARDFNWHNVIGFWSFAPLFLVVLSATVISYPWASNLVYRLVGETPPAAPGRPAPQAGPQAAPQVAGGAAAGGRGERRAGEGRPEGARPEGARAAGVSIENLNQGWARAEQHTSGWKAITLRLPASAEAPLAFTIDHGYAGEPQNRATLTLDRSTAEVQKWEPFASLSAGRRLRSFLRFAHTGEVGGLTGQTIAGLVSLGGAFLVYTGLALALRRFLAWVGRRRVRAPVSTPPFPEGVSEN
jgi:uncharacterized iron-regulated membrane protein